MLYKKAYINTFKNNIYLKIVKTINTYYEFGDS